MNMKKMNIYRFIPLIICLICAIICFTLAGTVFSDNYGSGDSLKFFINKDSSVNIISKKSYSDRIEIKFTVNSSGYYAIYSNSSSYCSATLKDYNSINYLNSDNFDGSSYNFNVSSSLSSNTNYILTVTSTRSTPRSSKINITIKR